MNSDTSESESYLSQLRLLLEELCCDVCRFEHVSRDGLAPESIQIDRECYLGVPGAFADIRVQPPGEQIYFVEVKYGYSNQALVQHLHRKYGSELPALRDAIKVVLVVDCRGRKDWQRIEAEIVRGLRTGLQLEVWDEARLAARLRERFGVEMEAITEDSLLDVRQAIDRSKGFHAFGGTSIAEYDNDPLRAQLLWHFSFWRLRQLRERRNLVPRDILRPGLYQDVVVLIADLCSFSSYVRDTREDEVIRHNLTAFYSKARYQILNNGGMLYQFVGDEVVGLFGVPEHSPGYIGQALETARSLVDIGNSVSDNWQRHIDRVQESSGLHIGMAIGDLQVVSLRPFSRTHMGAIGDPLNVAARLMTAAGPSEIVVSNSLYHGIEDVPGTDFREIESLEARNVGRIRAWKWSLK